MSAAPNPIEGITLRDYHSGDDAAMYALDLECFEPTFRFTRRAMHRFAEQPDAIVLLAESSHLPPQLAAFVIAHMEGRTAYIVTLDVAQAFRRSGLARALMAETESRARAAGAQEIALHVFTGNSGAIAFYESLGYSRLRMAENFYAHSVHALVYQKQMSERR
ncbi:MAG TPA: N-acetyltransferase [Acidobacteriaceae bacterium]